MADQTVKAQGWIKIAITAAVVVGGWIGSHVRLEARLNGHIQLSDQQNYTQDVAIMRIDTQGSRQLSDYSVTLKTVENDVKHLTASLVELKADWKAGQLRIETYLQGANKPKID